MKLGGAALTSAILIALSLGATANPLSSCYDYSGAYDFGVDDCRSGRVIRALRDKYDELNAAADTPCGSSFFRDLRDFLTEVVRPGGPRLGGDEVRDMIDLACEDAHSAAIQTALAAPTAGPTRTYRRRKPCAR